MPRIKQENPTKRFYDLLAKARTITDVSLQEELKRYVSITPSLLRSLITAIIALRYQHVVSQTNQSRLFYSKKVNLDLSRACVDHKFILWISLWLLPMRRIGFNDLFLPQDFTDGTVGRLVTEEDYKILEEVTNYYPPFSEHY